MRIALLGSLQVETADGVEQDLRGHRARLLMALLATKNGEVVSVDEITEALWHDDGATVTTNALHVQISKLRRTLSAGADLLPLRTVDRGYLLEAAPDDVDISRFERLARHGAELLAEARHDEAAAVLDEALGLWRGPALAEFASAEFAVIERHRLDELRALAQEHRIDALLASGRHERLVAELEEAVTVDPLRERRWSQLMLALYRSGRQADALRAYGRARRALIEEIGVEPGPSLREMEQAILRHDPALDHARQRDAPTPGQRLAPVAAPDAYTTNIRADLSSFVGRANDLEQLTELVATRRLVSIVGPGGVGKTRMASEIAGRPNAAWGHGSWMLELHATTGPDGVARALLTSFGGHPGPANASIDVQSAVDAVAAAIADAAVLLVLDNCEHVVGDARAAASALLDQCPNLRILTTSRVVLDVRGETVRQLQPLAIDDAVTLFGERGLDAFDGFAVDDGNHGAVRSICEHVDRLPLGVELAAARLRAFTPAQLDAQLGDRLSALASTGDARDARHRTLPATVAWSYDLLFAQERTLLRGLSVFRGSFALDAVEAVAAHGDVTAADVADALARLVDKSLVVAERGAREPRYRLLRTVADFAAAAAADLGETEDLRRRHADWVAHLAARASTELRGRDQSHWAARLRDDASNIDAAVAFARDGRHVAVGLRTCADLTWFALTTTSLPTVLDDMRALIAQDEAGPSAQRARALAWSAVIGAGMADAPEMAATAIAVARALADEHVLAEALIVTAMPMSRSVRTADSAVAAAREGRELAGHAGDGWLQAAADAVEGGSCALTVAGLSDAVAFLERAGQRYSDLGDERSAEINAWYLSQAHEDNGDTARAAAVLEPFVGDAAALDSAGAILDTARMSWLAQRDGDSARAARYAERLTSIATVQHRRLFWGAAQFAIGHVALEASDLDRADAALHAALDMHVQIGMERFVIFEHALLGAVAQRAGRDAESIAHHDEAIERAQAYALPLPHILALELAAPSALRRGQPSAAIDLQTRATELRATHGLEPTAYERARGDEILLLTAPHE